MTRLTVKEEVIRIGKYDLEGSIDSAIKFFLDVKEGYPEAYIESAEEYDGDFDYTIKIERLESDREYARRKDAEQATKEYRRKYYEQLKKEFE